MVYPQWNPIPTFTARHNSKIRRNNEPYSIRNIKEYLENPIGCEVSAENADPQDRHLTDVKIENGTLTFHTAYISNEITERIVLTAKVGDIVVQTVMDVNIWEF